MGHMPPNYFFHDKSRDVKNKHNIEGETWPQTMCPHILKKK
jgi:hypothetical protein